jgi:putative hemolysin
VPSFALELTVVLLLILVNGLFAMSELAIVSSRKARLEQRANAGDRRAAVALELANDPNQLLSTIQVGITLIGIVNGAFGGATMAGTVAEVLRQVPPLAPYAAPIAFALVVSAITYLSLVVGELVPKRLALNDPERVAVAVAVPMRALSRLASPIVRLLGASNDLVLRLLGVRPSAEAPVTEEEIKILLEQGTEAGVFQETEQEIVESVFRLGDREVGSLMTPRPDVAWLDLEDPPAEIRRVIVECRHSRFPVGRGSLDDVVGVAQAKAILAHDFAGGPLDLEACTDRPVFVPESMPAFRALETFKRSGVQMALVLDEYGGIQGLVTAVDILEAIVGDLPSPEELAEPPAVRRDDGSWLLDGALPTDELGEFLGIGELPREHRGDYRTVGGFVMARLGRVPAAGDRVDWGGLRFEVVDMDGRRVDKVLATPLGSDGAGETSVD